MNRKIKIRKKIYNNLKLHPFSNSTNGITVSKDLLFKRTLSVTHISQTSIRLHEAARKHIRIEPWQQTT